MSFQDWTLLLLTLSVMSGQCSSWFQMQRMDSLSRRVTACEQRNK